VGVRKAPARLLRRSADRMVPGSARNRVAVRRDDRGALSRGAARGRVRVTSSRFDQDTHVCWARCPRTATEQNVKYSSPLLTSWRHDVIVKVQGRDTEREAMTMTQREIMRRAHEIARTLEG